MSRDLSHSETMAVLLSTALRHLETSKDALAGAQAEMQDAVAAERERSAKIADTPLPDDGGHFTDEAFQHGIEYASQLIAERIRSGE